MPVEKFHVSIALSLLTFICLFPLCAQTFNKAANGITIRDTVRLESRSAVAFTCSEGFPGTDVYLNINGHRGYEQIDTMEYGSAVTMGVGTRQICWWKFVYPDPYKQDSALQKSSESASASFSVHTVDYVGVAGVFVRGNDTIRPYFDEGQQQWILQIGNANEPFSFVANGLLPGAYVYFGLDISGTFDPPFAGASGGQVVIVPKGCPVVELSKDHITPGDTVTIRLKEKINDTTIVELPPHQGFYLYLTSGENYGKWIDGEIDGNRTFVTTSGRFVANDSIDVGAATVTISALPWFSIKSECGTATASVVITTEEGCPAVVLSDSTMHPKDTIDVSVKKKINDSTFSNYKAGQLFNVQITEGANYGDLLEVQTGKKGDNLEGVKMPIRFIATDSIDADNVECTIYGVPVEAIPSAVIKKGVEKNAGTKPVYKVTGLPACSKTGEKLTIQQPIDSIDVTNCLQEILNTDQATIGVQFYNSKNNPATPSDSTKISIFIAPEGTLYSKLKLNTNKPKEDTVLWDVAYKDIKEGRVIFTGNGKDIPGKFPLGVRIVALTKIDTFSMENYGTVFLKNATTPGVRYSQSSKPWDTAAYDSYRYVDEETKDTVQAIIGGKHGKGCTLTCLAMILKAEGKDYDPLTLNKYMTDSNYFDKYGGVKTDVLSDRVPGIKEDKEKGDRDNLKNNTPIKLSELDSYLDHGSYVIAQVKHKRSDGSYGQHWVLITGKNNGIYSIIDPGGIGKNYCKNVVLDVYKNEVFRAKIFTRK